MESKFLNKYQKFDTLKPEGALYGDRLLLEIVDIAQEHKTEGGLFIAESDHARSDFVMLKATVGIVLEVGNGYYDPDLKEDVALTTKVGDVVWVPEQSVRYTTTIPNHTSALPNKVLALGSEGQIIKKWPSIEAYNNDTSKLSEC